MGAGPERKPAHANAYEWQYHQDGRDRAATLGCAGLVFIALLVALAAAAVALRIAVDDYEAQALAEEEPMDGSNAGANAVTFEDLGLSSTRDEWEAGAWSVTVEDLEREYDAGAYPPNGKNTPLDTDSTYGKGAGMVDLLTYDTATNVMIRHYGQVEPDGRVRWYAAETVLDEDGKPRTMPKN